MYRGIYTAPPTAGEGMQMVYVPDRQMIRMEGWHSNRQGMIQAVEMPLGEFLSGLGILLADCQTALQGGGMSQPEISVAGPPVRRAASETAPQRQPAVPSQAPPRESRTRPAV